MSKVPEDIERLQKWAAWVTANRDTELDEDYDAAKAVMNLIAYVGTLEARVDEESQNYVDMMDLRDKEIREKTLLTIENEKLKRALKRLVDLDFIQTNENAYALQEARANARQALKGSADG